MLTELFYLFLLFGIPTIAFVFFVVSLIRYLISPKGTLVRTQRRKWFLISLIPLLVCTSILVILALMLVLAIAYM